MPYVRYLACRNPECLQPIPLPPPKSHDMQSNQAELPTVGWRHFFLCLGCKQVSEYSERHVQTEIQDTQDPWEHDEYSCWSIQYDCESENCEIQIETFVVSGKFATPQAIHRTFDSISHALRQCPSGKHEAREPINSIQIRVVPCSLPYLP